MTEQQPSPRELESPMKRLTQVVERLESKVDDLGTVYVPREVFDLAKGGLDVDVRRLTQQQDDLERRVDDNERETNRRFRQAETLGFSALVAPIVTGIVVALIVWAVTSS